MASWQQFDRREQGLLLLVGGILALLLLWLVLLQPLSNMVTDQQANNTILNSQLQQARAMAVELKQLKGNSKSGNASNAMDLQRMIAQSLRSHGLATSNFTPNSDSSCSLRFDQVSFNTLAQWLHQMEMSHGVAVDNLAINPTGDSGIVKVSVRLRGNK